MASSLALHRHHQQEHKGGKLAADFKEIILGGQDGLVNVLGVVLGVAAGTHETRIVLIAGAAATFAESISMAAVAYTSTKAAQSYYESQRQHELREIKEIPDMERQEIMEIYEKKGFRGRLLADIVSHITRDKKLWLESMMTDELGLTKKNTGRPLRSAAVVGIAALAGSLVPLIPFVFLPIASATILSLVLCALTLFATGSIEARLTVGRWWLRGIEMAIIGMLAALVGYGVGAAVGAVV